MHCRHDPRPAQVAKKPTDNPIKPSVQARYSAERRFEPWTLVEPPKSRTEDVEPSKPACQTRSYGWDEIQQDEDERERLRYLLSIWDLERKAILKLQHDLNKNLFQRIRDSIKRIGQSVGLGLWLWVHRPATCTQMRNVRPNVDPLGQMGSIDTLPDAPWLKHFVFDQSEETLPPIARAMKNMLDQNVFIMDAGRETENPWPHFNNSHYSSSIDAFRQRRKTSLSIIGESFYSSQTLL